jgi:GNAT superfamily N-acetyltransferase
MRCRTITRGDIDIEACLVGSEVHYVAHRGSRELAWGSAQVYGKHYVVTGIQVDDAAQRTGIGTKMWEAFASDACAAGLPLASDELRSHFAEAFWRKQQAKGRVECRPGKGEVYVGPLASLKRRLKDGKITREAFEAKTKDLPVSDGKYWPCMRYELPRPCGQRLDGLRKRRRR